MSQSFRMQRLFKYLIEQKLKKFNKTQLYKQQMNMMVIQIIDKMEKINMEASKRLMLEIFRIQYIPLFYNMYSWIGYTLLDNSKENCL